MDFVERILSKGDDVVALVLPVLGAEKCLQLHARLAEASNAWAELRGRPRQKVILRIENASEDENDDIGVSSDPDNDSF